MRAPVGVLLVPLCACLLAPRAGAQGSAGPGVLAPLPARGGTCRTGDAERTVTLVFEGSAKRSLTAGTSTTGAVVTFGASASTATADGSGESETVTASFGGDERLRGGERAYFAGGGVRRTPLGGGDALAALYLAKQVLARCATTDR